MYYIYLITMLFKNTYRLLPSPSNVPSIFNLFSTFCILYIIAFCIFNSFCLQQVCKLCKMYYKSMIKEKNSFCILFWNTFQGVWRALDNHSYHSCLENELRITHGICGQFENLWENYFQTSLFLNASLLMCVSTTNYTKCVTLICRNQKLKSCRLTIKVAMLQIWRTVLLYSR